MHFILKYFPEITIKSDPVRKRMSRQLTENLRILLRRFDPGARVIQDWDKLEVYVPGDETARVDAVSDLLACVPGIANFARVQIHPLGDLQSIYEHTFATWANALAGKTFCVRAKRKGQHNFTSNDVERFVGGGLLHNTTAKGVDLHHPDILVQLEVRDQQLYVVNRAYTGLGGFPIGTQEAVLALVSGGFDSTVASFQSIKRGLKTHFLFFNLGGKAHEIGVKEIAFYLWNRFGSSHRVKFITIPFEDMVAEILDKVDPSCMGVVLKRMMLRAASQVADHAGVDALITGEAVAQVSSQTLPNLAIIDRASSKLVLRPLAFMDKGVIIDQCRAIGAEHFAAQIPEYCGVISVRPSAHLRAAKVEKEEARMDDRVLTQALERARIESIDSVMADAAHSAAQVEVFQSTSDHHQVIDIRHPQERELQPLHLQNEVVAPLAIPFYSLNGAFPNLDTSKVYLLYCAKGVMSQLHAAHLRDAGHTNIGVYRPETSAASRAKSPPPELSGDET